jgi:hypothetical protein
MKRKSTGRPQTDQNVVDQVEELVVENPHSSTRHMSAQTNVSHTNVRRILSRRLHMHPERVCSPKNLAEQLFSKKLLNNDDVLDVCIFTDPSRFHLSGYVNKQKNRKWSVNMVSCILP